MIIGLARKQLGETPDGTNVAQTLFGRPGLITAQQVRSAIAERPDSDYVNVFMEDGRLALDTRTKEEIPGPFHC
jgi:hypothetical protein